MNDVAMSTTRSPLLVCSLFSGLILAQFGENLLAWHRSDPASGRWEGDWFIMKIQKPLGGLNCDIERTGPDEWKAEFEAEFGQTAIYRIPLTGRRDRNRVVFGGDVDLGAASGGVFTWTGDADGKEFNGTYTSLYYKGTFKLHRVDPSSD